MVTIWDEQKLKHCATTITQYKYEHRLYKLRHRSRPLVWLIKYAYSNNLQGFTTRKRKARCLDIAPCKRVSHGKHFQDDIRRVKHVALCT